VYFADLSGPAESPPTSSLGTGSARVDLDLTAHTLQVQVTFGGLVAATTASHIHACTTTAAIGTAGVATQVPTFVGFPLGVTSGSYVHTFDTRDAATYNPAFVTANGGTAAGAESALAECVATGRAYLNVHSTAFPGGEIRGFLTPAPAAYCGMTIRSDFQLDRDLTGCPGDGVIIDADNAVIDLGGHTISGHKGVGTGIVIRVAPPGSVGAPHITILNGTVQDFNDGVRVGRSATLRSLRVSGNPHSGISLIPHGPPGQFLTTEVLNSYIDDNGTAFGNGDGTLGSLSFSHNFIAWNGTVGDFGSGSGTATSLGLVEGNEIAFNGGGVQIREFGGGILRNNEFWQNDGDAIQFLLDCPSEVTGNGFFFNSGAAIGGGAFGRGPNSTCNFSDNTMWDNGVGIQVGGIAITYTIDHNLITSNKVAGIWVNGRAAATITNNTVARNGAPPAGGSPTDENGVIVHDGIHVDRGGLLQGNQSYDNVGLGIFAPTATDGGNNVAYTNGNPAQCAGVTCLIPF